MALHQNKNDWTMTLWGVLAAFSCYTCAYAFRKGITAATFSGLTFGGIDYKIWLVTVQVLGYAVAKLIGIKVVSEMTAARRPFYLLGLLGVALGSLVGFAWVAAPFNIPFFFVNGLSLGMVYGVVFGFLEGRRQTDALVAGLTASFIFGSGLVKTVGLLVLEAGVSEFLMPLVVALIFTGPLLLAVWALAKLPLPSAADRLSRTERRPMNAPERRAFVKTFGVGLIAFIFSFALITAFRDFRDNFALEILRPAGVKSNLIFTQSETAISVLIVLLLGSLRWVNDNWRAFKIINVLLLLGGLLVGGSTWCYQQDWLPAEVWFMLTGLGLYLAYVPCNGLYFERFVAAFRYAGTVGFMITLADWWGYLGSVMVMLYKNFAQPSISFFNFFVWACYGLSTLYILLVVSSFWYFQRQYSTLKLDKLFAKKVVQSD